MRPPRPGRRPFELLTRSPAFRLLFLATLASSLGTWLAFVALVIDVYDRTSDARWVSALLVAEFLPFVVIGFLAGPLVDRFPRRTVLVASDLTRAAVFCALPFAGGPLQVVLLALAAGVATTFFRPALYAALPNVVDDADLGGGNSLFQSAENATIALGPFVGGAVVAAAGTRPAYWFNAATFVVSAVLIVRIKRTLEAERRESEGHWRSVLAGLALVTRSRAAMTVLVAWGIVMVAVAGTNVSEVVLAKEVFRAGDFGFGLLASSDGLGLLVGSLVGGVWIERRGPSNAYPLAIALMAGGFASAALMSTVWTALPFVAIAGLGNGAAIVGNALLVQRGVPDHLRGRAFMVLMSANYAVLGLAMAAAGPLTNAVGARVVWFASGLVLAVAAIVGFLLVRDVREAPAILEAPPPVSPLGGALPVHGRPD